MSSCIWFLYFGLLPRTHSQKWDYWNLIHIVELLSKRVFTNFIARLPAFSIILKKKKSFVNWQKVAVFCLHFHSFSNLQEKIVCIRFLTAVSVLQTVHILCLVIY